jgi:hypothetical protein
MSKLKFTVRHGFVVILESPQLDEKGEVVGTIKNTFPGGSTVELSAEDAAQHKHKLEALPGDKAAAKFLEPAPMPTAQQAQTDPNEFEAMKKLVEAQGAQIAQLLADGKK